MEQSFTLDSIYKLQEKIRVTDNAIYWCAMNTIVKKKVLVKQIKKCLPKQFHNRENAVNEIKIHEMMKHNFVVKFFQTIEDENYFYLIMEYSEKGSLEEFLQVEDHIKNEEMVKKIFSNILSAIEYIHSLNILHLNLSLNSCFVFGDDSVKISDFSSAIQLYPELISTKIGRDGINGSNNENRCLLNEKNQIYSSPQIINNNMNSMKKFHIASFSDDVWSLGVILYRLATGEHPFKSESECSADDLFEIINTAKIDFPDYLSNDLIDLISKILCNDESKRITIQEIKNHTWLPDRPRPSQIGRNSNNINDDILTEMEKYGFCPKKVTKELQTNKFTRGTAVYKCFLTEVRFINHQQQQQQQHINMENNTNQIPTSEIESLHQEGASASEDQDNKEGNFGNQLKLCEIAQKIFDKRKGSSNKCILNAAASAKNTQNSSAVQVRAKKLAKPLTLQTKKILR